MKFVDLKGREWQLRITHGTAMRIKADGANFYELEADKGAKLKELYEDNFALALWLWRIVKHDATGQSVTEEDFYDSLGGVAMARARLAFLEAYSDFTQNPAIHYSLKEQVVMETRANAEMERAGKKVVELARQHMADQVGQISDENIERMFSELLSEAKSKTQHPSSPQPTSSVPSSV